MKRYDRILDKRLRKEVDSQLNEAETELCECRSIYYTPDFIFTIRQIIDNTLQRGNEAFFVHRSRKCVSQSNKNKNMG